MMKIFFVWSWVSFFIITLGLCCQAPSSPQPLSAQHPASIFLANLAKADTNFLQFLMVEKSLVQLEVVNWNKSMHKEALTELKATIQSSTYQVYTWEQAKEKFPERVQLNVMNLNTAQELVVIMQKKKVFYLQMKGEKYHSILPLSKGNVIIGWL